MSRLSYSYSDLCGAVATFLGISTSDSTSLAKCKQVVDSGYSHFLNAHKWSFLKKLGSLVTITNQWQYALPEDFVVFTNQLVFDPDGNQYPPLTPVSYDMLLDMRRVNDYSSWPSFFSVIDGDYTEETGSSRHICFYPTPSAAYRLHFTYESFPVKMVEDAHVPVGGPEFAELVRAYVLAEAEMAEELDAKIWAKRLPGMLEAAIQRDNRRKSSWNLGYFGDGPQTTSRPNRDIRVNNVSYEVE